MKLLFINLLLLALPFLFASVQQRLYPSNISLLVYYRYFVFFNVILVGFFLVGRLFFRGPQDAAAMGWAYTPLYTQYALTILSIVIMALVTLFSRGSLNLAAAICWSIFLLFSVVMHLFEWHHGALKLTPIILVHLVFDSIVALILLRFVFLLKNASRKQRFSYQLL